MCPAKKKFILHVGFILDPYVLYQTFDFYFILFICKTFTLDDHKQ